LTGALKLWAPGIDYMYQLITPILTVAS